MKVRATTWGVISGALWMVSAEGIFVTVGALGESSLVLLISLGVLSMGALVAGYWAYGRGLEWERECEQEPRGPETSSAG